MALVPHLDGLAGALGGELAAGKREAVLETMLGAMLEGAPFADLGRFLTAVSARPELTEATREQAAQASKALAESLLAVNDPKLEQPPSGLSFCPFVNDFADSRLPANWKTFITQMSQTSRLIADDRATRPTSGSPGHRTGVRDFPARKFPNTGSPISGRLQSGRPGQLGPGAGRLDIARVFEIFRPGNFRTQVRRFPAAEIARASARPGARYRPRGCGRRP